MPKLLFFFQLTKLGTLIELHENFVKGSDRNRCYVLSDKGIERLSVPIKWTHGVKMPIQKVAVDYTQNWNVKHLRALKSYYGSAPYFDYFWDEIENLLSRRYETLFELNCESIRVLGRLLGLKLDINFTTDFELDNATIEQAQRAGFVHPQYYQVFSERLDFVDGLSALDYLFCEGKADSLFENLVLNQSAIINAPIIK